ncbi:GNAT family N-acetyltransferase [Fluviicola sp.]|uniref:GNAT family N-acetyltransferase n=1 Tax=Fluviicola sp. TaxID=1917219 RepID=UPI0031DEEAEE
MNHIRPYHQQDQESVLHLFDANCPAYFAPEERVDLENYLDSELEDYFVIESDGKIVASGGINLRKEENKGVLSWGIIHPDYHGKGIGRVLVSHRVNHLKTVHQVERIGVRTTQLVHGFYAKCGFELKKVVKDYWAPGYDLYDMDYKEKA